MTWRERHGHIVWHIKRIAVARNEWRRALNRQRVRSGSDMRRSDNGSVIWRKTVIMARSDS